MGLCIPSPLAWIPTSPLCLWKIWLSSWIPPSLLIFNLFRSLGTSFPQKPQFLLLYCSLDVGQICIHGCMQRLKFLFTCVCVLFFISKIVSTEGPLLVFYIHLYGSQNYPAQSLPLFVYSSVTLNHSEILPPALSWSPPRFPFAPRRSWDEWQPVPWGEWQPASLLCSSRTSPGLVPLLVLARWTTL